MSEISTLKSEVATLRSQVNSAIANAAAHIHRIEKGAEKLREIDDRLDKIVLAAKGVMETLVLIQNDIEALEAARVNHLQMIADLQTQIDTLRDQGLALRNVVKKYHPEM